MAFAESTTTVTSGGAAMLLFKAALVASTGWTIEQTSDGTNYSATDILMTAADLNNAGAFFVATATTGQQFLFVRGGSSQAWDISYSASGTFAGGSAGVPPTAPDGYPAFTGWTLFPGVSFDVHLGIEDASEWRWWIAVVPGGNLEDNNFVASIGAASHPMAAFNVGFSEGQWFDVDDAAVFAGARSMLLATGGGGGGDTTAPDVALVTPADGSAIARSAPLVIDVTDASDFASIFAWVVYPNGNTEVAYDGEAFTAAFAGSSTRVSISGGYRYTLRRAGGWPAAPTIRVRPVDVAGNTP